MRQRCSRLGRVAAVVVVLLGVTSSAACRSRPAVSVPGQVDEAIATEVRQRLERVDDLDVTAIEVRVRDGVVELAGVVRTLEQARDALRQAGRVRGVRQVVNRLVVLDGSVTGT